MTIDNGLSKNGTIEVRAIVEKECTKIKNEIDLRCDRLEDRIKEEAKLFIDFRKKVFQRFDETKTAIANANHINDWKTKTLNFAGQAVPSAVVLIVLYLTDRL